MTASSVDKIKKAKARALSMLEATKSGTFKSVNFSHKPTRQTIPNEPTVYNEEAFMKYMTLEDIISSTETQRDDAQLHFETMKAGVLQLKKLYKRMCVERRLLKETRKTASRMGLSSKYANQLLAEQMQEMVSVRSRMEGIQAQANAAATYAWEYSSILEKFSDMSCVIAELKSKVAAYEEVSAVDKISE